MTILRADQIDPTIAEYANFCERVGVIRVIECCLLGIEPDSLSGIFDSRRVHELLRFCAENPGYHIVFYMKDGSELNHMDPKALWYYLADGDDDPALFFRDPHPFFYEADNDLP